MECTLSSEVRSTSWNGAGSTCKVVKSTGLSISLSSHCFCSSGDMSITLSRGNVTFLYGVGLVGKDVPLPLKSNLFVSNMVDDFRIKAPMACRNLLFGQSVNELIKMVLISLIEFLISSYLPSAPVTVEYGDNEGVAIGPACLSVCELVLFKIDFG